MLRQIILAVANALGLASTTAQNGFGQLGADGKYTICAEGINASFIPYGASITNLFVEDRNGTYRDVVLGYDNATAYEGNPYGLNMGAIVGRYANRIVNHTYELDGQQYYTSRNQPPNSTIHSGPKGWSNRKWKVAFVGEDYIGFGLEDVQYSSKGMPGNITALVTYELTPYTLKVEISAYAHQRTPLMATTHAYWNLDAFANPVNDTIFKHQLAMPKSRTLIQYDTVGEPNSTLYSIPAFSVYDFTFSRPIDMRADDPHWNGLCNPGVAGYDCAWVIDDPDVESRDVSFPLVDSGPAATLYSDWTGIQMDMYTNQAAIAMTSCGFFPRNTLPIKKSQGGVGTINNGYVPPSGCIAIEPSDWIAGINFPEWEREKYQIYGPDTEIYVNEMQFKFSKRGWTGGQ